MAANYRIKAVPPSITKQTSRVWAYLKNYWEKPTILLKALWNLSSKNDLFISRKKELRINDAKQRK